MNSPITKHAAVRAQQRCLPKMIDELLDRFGEEMYDGQGCVIQYFSKASRKNVEREWGKHPVACISQWLDAYKVSSTDGTVITCGHHHKRIKRR